MLSISYIGSVLGSDLFWATWEKRSICVGIFLEKCETVLWVSICVPHFETKLHACNDFNPCTNLKPSFVNYFGPVLCTFYTFSHSSADISQSTQCKLNMCGFRTVSGAGKQSAWRANEVESIGWNAISEPTGHCLKMISFFKNISPIRS